MALSLYPTRLTEAHFKEAFPEHWNPELKQTVRLWLKDLQTGIRPLTPRSIETFRERFIRYTFLLQKEFGYHSLSVQQCLDLKSAYSIISSFPIESYSNRHNTFYAIHSLARFLIRLGELEEEYIPKLKKFRPKRVIPPKRTVLRGKEELSQIREALKPEDFRNYWTYLTQRTVIETLIQTGLRNAEACQLKLEDIDLINGRLTVTLGKGRKNRKIGIPKGLVGYLETYLPERLKRSKQSPFFFLNSEDLPLHPTTLGRMIKKVSDRAGVKITAHGLRRTFATLNSEQGKPLHLIQLALGHSDIRTTQEYLMTDQEAVVEAMRDW